MVRLRSVLRGMAAIVLLTAPVLADDGPPSMIAIAQALRGNDAQRAEMLATQMMAAPQLAPLDVAYLHMNRGLAREKLGHLDEALSDFSAAIDANVLPAAEQARALFDRGVTLDEAGRTQSAIADYSQAITIVPRYAVAFNNRGNAYRRLKKFELARADYEAALGAGDDEPEFPLYGLGRVAEAQGDAVLAQSFYHKALAANAGYGPASARLATLASLSAPASYVLRDPQADVPVQTNLPVAAPTVPVAEGDVATAPDLVAPPLKAPSPVPEHKQRTVNFPESRLGLRPAILDVTHTPPPVRVAVAAQPKSRAHKQIAAPQAAHEAMNARSVQLGAWKSEADAANGWNRIVDRAGGLLNGMTPQVIAADIPGKGRFWRLRSEPSSDTDAATLCAQLRAKGLACVIAKG